MLSKNAKRRQCGVEYETFKSFLVRFFSWTTTNALDTSRTLEMKLDTTFLALVRAPQHRFDISKHSAAAAAVHPNSTHSLIYLELERVANGAEKKAATKEIGRNELWAQHKFSPYGRIPFNHTVQRVELCVLFFFA